MKDRIQDIVEKAVSEAGNGQTPPPPDFDEEAYLIENPDVARQVLDGGYSSGYIHYILHGRVEATRRPTRQS